MLIIESTKCPRKCVYEEKHEKVCPQVLKIGQYTYICHPCKMITRTTETQLSYMSSSYWTKLFLYCFSMTLLITPVLMKQWSTIPYQEYLKNG